MKTKYTLKNKKRFSLCVLIFLLVALTGVYKSAVYGYKEPGYDTVIVRSGDTLWGIASKYKTHGDIRQYIYQIKKNNHIEDGKILEGQTLNIPVQE